jgi:hypothetical protein
MNCDKHNIPLRQRALSAVTTGKPLWCCDKCEEEEEKKEKNKEEIMPETEKKSISAYTTMCVREPAVPFIDRIDGNPDPPNASIIDGWGFIKTLLTYFQEKGVIPGQKIKITIEEL